MLNIGRLLRTLHYLTPGQVGWRAVHELRFAVYRRSNVAARLWPDNPQAQFVGGTLSPHPFLMGREAAERCRNGFVEYLGIRGRMFDWRPNGLPRLWRYEHHYHRELVGLAALTAVERSGPWAGCAEQLIESWSAANPIGAGDGWEPYPVSRRILNWAIAGCLVPSLGQGLAGRLATHARFLSRHLERHLLGNHLICNAAALVAASAVLDADGLEAAGERALTILARELRAQLLDDGGYAERTIQYHSIVLADLILALGFRRARGRLVPNALLDAANAMLAFQRTVQRPDGSYPWLNDAAPDATFSTAWLAGLAAAFGLEEVRCADADVFGDILLPETGWQIVRECANELLFEAGPIGPEAQAGHGHSDALSFELRWRGRPIVVDTGATTYDVGEMRAFERSARAHSVVTVDESGPDELWAAFRVAARAETPSMALERRGEIRILRGVLRAPGGWVHSRALVYWPEKVLVVADRITGAAARACVSRVPLAPGISRSGEVLRCGDLALRFRVLHGAEANSETGWVGDGFGHRRARDTIAVRFAADGKALYAFDCGRVDMDVVQGRLHLAAEGTAIDIELP